MDFIVIVILRTENDKKMNIGLLAAFSPCRGVKMRISRGFRHPWLLAASLMMGGAAAPLAAAPLAAAPLAAAPLAAAPLAAAPLAAAPLAAAPLAAAQAAATPVALAATAPVALAAATEGSDTHRVSRPPHAAADNATHLSHGRFKDLLVYRPSGPPTSFALLLSGDEGWNSVADTMARQLVQQGAIVTGIDWAKFKANLEADGDQCVFPDGDLENLSHFVQAYFHTPTYMSPMLVGNSSGAAMAYAMLAQAPRNTFAAALTLGFCPTLDLAKPLCKGSGLESIRSARGRGVDFLPVKNLGNPWVNLQGANDRVCPAGATRDFISQVRGAAMVMLPNVGHDFRSLPDRLPQYTAAYDKLAAQNPTTRVAPPPAELSDLPIVEIAAQPVAAQTGGAQPGGAQPDTARTDFFAIIMSGDGGWAGLDQDVAAALRAKGIPVVGLDSLRYYWTPRTPEGLAADTDRMIRHYLAHFGKQRVLLIGYSQGADVLPFAVNRLPEPTRARVALVAVMGMSEHALFEFHLSSWISDSNSGPATLPEINRIGGVPVLCMYGADESDSLCPQLDPKKFIIVKLKGGHHFDGDYANLARQILAAAHP
jgi:type IV secretory pathway VirJ component